jgi:hypothetical protein
LLEALTAQANTAINAAKGEDHELRLLVEDWSGLNESDKASLIIQTPAARELADYIADGGGGSIGLAGPRGAGKTTLMRQYCPRKADSAGGTKNLAFMIEAPVAYVASDFLVLLFTEVCHSYLALRGYKVNPEPAGAPPALWRLPGFRLRRRARQVPAPAWPLLVDRAYGYLDKLQFVTTYSATLSITAAIPVVQPGASGGSSMAQRAMSHPELVDELRWFLERVTEEVNERKGKVFIGIDEIDKIGSGQEAQQFVNELKVIFGVPH